MYVIAIPLVVSDTRVTDAIELLRRRQRSGLVVDRANDHYHLLHAGDLLRARANKTVVVADVPGGHPVHLLDIGSAQKFGLDLIRPNRTPVEYERMFKAQKVTDYALVGDSGDTAVIVTRHEPQGDSLMMAGGYECSGTPTHYFPEPRVSVGEECPQYPECSDPSGTPKIRPA